MMRACHNRSAASGFTLIEAAVALAILALALSVLYESFGGALRRGASELRREEAWSTAQSLLSETRASLRVGEKAGSTAGGLNWTSRVEEYPIGASPTAQWHAYKVSIRVGAVELQSIEIGGGVT